MLPRARRLRRPAEFTDTFRRGVRAGRRTVVVHVALPAEERSHSSARFGFAVSRAVGDAVARNQVTRRLRHIAATHTGELPAGTSVVVRALPPAADATFEALSADFQSALTTATSRAMARQVAS